MFKHWLTAFSAALLLVFSLSASVAESADILEKRLISGWQVMKVQTPNDGLSCQAFKRNTRACKTDTAEASFRLWGSQRRMAVTPMIGMQLAVAGADKPTITVDGQTFPLVQREQSRGRLFIAKRPEDDATIMRLAARSVSGTVRFTSGKGSAVFRLKGVNKVLRFFELECGIPQPS